MTTLSEESQTTQLNMPIICLIIKGERLDYPDGELARQGDTLIGELLKTFAKAIMAYFHIELDRQRFNSMQDIDANREQQRIIRESVAKRLVDEVVLPPHYDVRFKIESESEYHAWRWKQGELPQEYLMADLLRHKHAYVVEIDFIRRILIRLSSLFGKPQHIEDAILVFNQEFPHVKDLRDSLAHREERALGEAKGKPIQTRSVSNNYIEVGAGNTFADIFWGDSFGWTVADGNYRDIKITFEMLLLISDLIRKTLNSLNWTGSPRHWPV